MILANNNPLIIDRSSKGFTSGGPTKDQLEQGALILIDKPAGWTSFDVVNKIRRAIKVKKVGHCGTLDPIASGLLLVVTGRATRLADNFSGQDKVYEAEILLGKITDTLDREGRVISESTIAPLEVDKVSRACNSFVGEIEQVPPAFSALKVKGVPAYKLARRGREVALKPRSVQIHSLKILNYNHPLLSILVECSKGTYIRSLARDIGEKLGCGAIVQNLKRIRSGPFEIDACLNLSDFLTDLNLA